MQGIGSFCSGLPTADNSIFWLILYFGLGVSSSSILVTLWCATRSLRLRRISKFVASALSVASYLVSMAGVFQVVVLMRMLKINMPGPDAWGLLPLLCGAAIVLLAIYLGRSKSDAV